MRLFLSFAAAVALAVPAVSVATTAEAQVLAGDNAARGARGPRFTREERLTNLIYEAEDRLATIEEEIAALEAEGQTAGGMTASQQRKHAQLVGRREREQREIARLNTALGRSPDE